jgi:hypothetical protein
MRYPIIAAIFAGAVCLASVAPAVRGQSADMPIQYATTVSDDLRHTLLPFLPGIKAAPFSASFQTESKQVLADGSAITSIHNGKIARDSQGRTYNELTTVRGPAANPQTSTTVNIDDPASGVRIVLLPDDHTARRYEWTPLPVNAAKRQSLVPAGGAILNGTTGRPARPMGINSSLQAIQKEDLGVETLDGITVRHYRGRQTIPAGEIGNERDLVIFSEYWFSKDLRLNLKSVRRDPRFGEDNLTVSGVEKNEPPSSLFEIPADYKVVEERTSSATTSAVEAKP